LIEPGITKRTLERIGGQLFVASGRAHGKVLSRSSHISPAGPTPKDKLREVASRTFAEFDLTAEID
jgi:hypothetical protein